VAPLEIDPAVPRFSVEVQRAAGPLALDVLVDGVVRDVVQVEGPRVEIETPRGLGPGAVVVVHAAGPWPDDVGAWAIARVADPRESPGAFAARLAQAAGAPADLAVPADDEATRALLSRLRPTKVRASRLPVEILPEAGGPPWRELYAASAAILVALVAAVGRSRAIPLRALALGVGAIAGLCGGLYVVLRLLAG
jgi:hypothetical protein